MLLTNIERDVSKISIEFYCKASYKVQLKIVKNASGIHATEAHTCLASSKNVRNKNYLR